MVLETRTQRGGVIYFSLKVQLILDFILKWWIYAVGELLPSPALIFSPLANIGVTNTELRMVGGLRWTLTSNQSGSKRIFSSPNWQHKGLPSVRSPQGLRFSSSISSSNLFVKSNLAKPISPSGHTKAFARAVSSEKDVSAPEMHFSASFWWKAFLKWNPYFWFDMFFPKNDGF